MQIARPDALLTPQPASAGNSVVNKVRQLAEAMSDGSSASDLEKIEAYNAINRLVHGPRSTWYQTTTQEERDYVNNIRFKSKIGQAVFEMGDRMTRVSMAMDPSTNVPERVLAYINGMSDFEQQVFFATQAINTFSSLEDWKAQWEHQIAGYAEMLAGQGGESSVNVTLSEEAKQALEAESGAQKALNILETADQGVTGASVALSVLERAAETRAKAAEEKREQDDAQPQTRPLRLYEAGDNLSKAV